MMETAIYYGYSTIAQALSGVLALLAAFVLFRIQGIREAIAQYARQVAVAVPEKRDVQEAMERGEYRNVLALSEAVPDETLHRTGTGSIWADEARRRLRTLVGRENAILRQFRLSVYLSAVTIVLSIAVVVLAPWLVRDERTTTAVLAAAPILVSVCLGMIVQFIRGAVI